MTEYVRWLRGRVGHARVPLVYASTVVADARGAILFQRRADFGDAWWGLPGGLMELDEDITHAAIREVHEETGLRIAPRRLVGLYTSPDFEVTYPNGDQVQQVTACFAGGIVGGRLHPQSSEILEQRYFAPGAPPPLPPWYAAMLADFLAGRPEASFRSGSPGAPDHRPGETIQLLRRLVGGPEPLILPGASAIIRDGGHVLLQRRADDGRWGVPGGAMDLGERIDQTAIREVREETGLEVEPVQLIGVYSDPQWAVTYPNGDAVRLFMASFDCRVTGGSLRAEGGETLDVRWFPLDGLPADMAERHRVRVTDALAGSRQATVR